MTIEEEGTEMVNDIHIRYVCLADWVLSGRG